MSAHNPIIARTLPNGLTVLMREARNAPLASFWVWYRVGSRNELPGLTGLSHWVEHMQFKGTPSIAKGAIFRDVSKHGGVLNALTSNDWTAYFETLPADRLDLSLQIESDRMTNSLFDPEETEAERTVILSERQGAENRPTYLLYEEVIGAAFHAHPYRHMVIGYESDLRSISRDDLFGHYRRYYQPSNAIVSVAGDFDANDLFERIERAFGAIESGPEVPPVRAVEPPQFAERRVILRRPAPTAYLRMAFRTPPARHEDTAAILVADAVLSGGKGMGLGGGGPMGRSARLYRALVSTGLARAAGSDFDFFIDPYLLSVAVTALPNIEPQRIEEVVEQELTRIAEQPVPEDELARALKQVKAQYVYSAEGVTNQAFWMGQMELVDSYSRVDTLVNELERVTPADIQRVAQSYLTPSNRTVGWLLPSGPGGGSEDEEIEPAAALPFRRWFVTDGQPKGANTSAPRAPFERVQLDNGTVVLGQARPDEPTVAARIRLFAGAVSDPRDRPGLAAFTGRMLPRGTTHRSFEEFNEATDSLGATLGVEAGRHSVDLAIRCLREDLPTLVDLAADILRNPTFPDEEVEKVRHEITTAIREQDNDTRSVADRALRRLIYPANHPYHHRVSGEVESIATVTRDDLISFHRSHYGPTVMTVSIVGGIQDVNGAAALVRERFGDWSAQIPRPPQVEPVTPPAELVRHGVVVDGKSQTDLAIGFPTIARTDPDYYALETANQILGRLGLMGRLGANVRDRQGLAYYVYSSVEAGRQGSVWTSRAGIDPGNVERTLESIITEVQRLRDELVEDDELADAKSYMTGVLPLALETSDGVANLLQTIEYYDLGLDYLDRYPDIINALTREQLRAAAKTHLDPARVAVGIAGPPSNPNGEGTHTSDR